jgi:hypothetical protein
MREKDGIPMDSVASWLSNPQHEGETDHLMILFYIMCTYLYNSLHIFTSLFSTHLLFNCSNVFPNSQPSVHPTQIQLLELPAASAAAAGHIFRYRHRPWLVAASEAAKSAAAPGQPSAKAEGWRDRLLEQNKGMVTDGDRI